MIRRIMKEALALGFDFFRSVSEDNRRGAE